LGEVDVDLRRRFPDEESSGNRLAIDMARGGRLRWDAHGERRFNVGCRCVGDALPTSIAERIARDHASKRLCAEIQTWLPFGVGAPPALQGRALDRVSMAGGGIPGMKYLVRLSVLPTEEVWRAGKPKTRSWVWDAVRRPFRLLRKYGAED